MSKLWKLFLKLPNIFEKIRVNLDKNSKFSSVNLFFYDEARFGLMTHIGKYLTSVGVKPIVSYQHIFKTTYLYGSYSPIDGDSFVWEINGVDTTKDRCKASSKSKYQKSI